MHNLKNQCLPTIWMQTGSGTAVRTDTHHAAFAASLHGHQVGSTRIAPLQCAHRRAETAVTALDQISAPVLMIGPVLIVEFPSASRQNGTGTTANYCFRNRVSTLHRTRPVLVYTQCIAVATAATAQLRTRASARLSGADTTAPVLYARRGISSPTRTRASKRQRQLVQHGAGHILVTVARHISTAFTKRTAQRSWTDRYGR